ALRRVADDSSRWRGPVRPHGFDAEVKNGSAASELRCRCASLHHGSGRKTPTEYKHVARSARQPKRAPLDSVIPTTPSVPSCSEPSRYGLAMMGAGGNGGATANLDSPARDSVWD